VVKFIKYIFCIFRNRGDEKKILRIDTDDAAWGKGLSQHDANLVEGDRFSGEAMSKSDKGKRGRANLKLDNFFINN
jgi:hypothetical protein